MTRLLLISPAFHGYHRSIAKALTRLGYDVTTHAYDGGSRADRTMRKAVFQLPAHLGWRTWADEARLLSERTAEIVRDIRPERLLVVKGDLLDTRFWDEFAHIPSVLWLYDELRRTHHDAATLAPYHGIASYSHHDVAALADNSRPILHVPLAFDPDTPIVPRHSDDIVFVGAAYPRRVELLCGLASQGVRVRAYGRDWSSHPIDMARTYRWRPASIPAGRTLPLAEACGVMAGAPATLNIHGDQDGFTMRTFEASGSGAVQFIDRADVSEFYVPGQEVVVFEDGDELAELCRRAVRDDRWGDAIREAGRRRTLAQHTFAHRARELDMLWA